MSDNKDYTKKVFVLACTVIVFLAGVSFIPPVRIGGTLVKRANILSDIIEYDDSAIVRPGGEHVLDTSFLELFKGPGVKAAVETAAAVRGDSIAPGAAAAGSAGNTDGGGTAVQPAVSAGPVATAVPRRVIRPHVYTDSIVRIEDFSRGQAMMSRFYEALAFESSERTVRIAVLGDSFIEADIITADLREQLQMAYGGEGVGFVPFSTPLSKFRGTIKHTHSGWTNHNIIKHKSVPEQYKERFFISGMLSIPGEGATVDYSGVRFRSHIERAGTATLLFANRGHSSLTVTINDTIKNIYTPPSGEGVESIRIVHDGMSRLNIKVTDADGFIGYGMVMEDSTGVSVHNYSVRSNSGMALLGTDYEVNSQIDSLMRYDLVILQYGLNAMSPDVTNYNYYGRQLVRIIEYVKQCFPESAILVMSVGDRSSLKNGTAVTMPAVKAMLETQRTAAMAAETGFWNTFEAMGGDNSMPEFVEKKWAAKDYTHIGYPGGKYIASRLAAYINAAVESIREQKSNYPVLDPDTRERLLSLPGMEKPSPDILYTPSNQEMLSAEHTDSGRTDITKRDNGSDRRDTLHGRGGDNDGSTMAGGAHGPTAITGAEPKDGYSRPTASAASGTVPERTRHDRGKASAGAETETEPRPVNVETDTLPAREETGMETSPAEPVAGRDNDALPAKETEGR